MSSFGTPLIGLYDGRLVTLSIFIAISSSYAALDLGGRVAAARGWNRSAWLAGGAAAMGLGIWSMHFTGMLAFSLPVPVAYHWPTVLLSLLIAMLASAVALYVVSRKKMGRLQAWTGSVLMGLGIVGMHYVGMAAMRLSATCHYNPLLVAASVSIAILASLAALVFTFDYREGFRGTTVAKALSAAAMGAGIFLMHYTGMLSASFFPTTLLVDTYHAVSISSLGFSGIAIGTLAVQGVAILTSVGDRRLAMQAQELQTSERFRQIADNLQVVLALANAEFTELLYVNHAYCVIWGRTLESVYAEPKSWLEGIHAEDRARVEESLQRLVGGESIDDLECRVVRPDGSTSWVACRGYPIRDAQGHVYRLVSSAQDITERKLAEQELRQAEDRIRAILEFSPNWIFLKDTEGRYLLVNREVERVFRLSQEQIKGKTDSEIFPPEQAAEYRANDLKVLREGLTMEFEETADLEDGPHTSIVHKFPLFDTHGNIYATGGVATDITERKRAEEALRHSEEQHRIVVETATDAVISINEDSQILFANPATTRIFGYESSELIGQPLTMLMPEFLRELHKTGFQHYLETGQRHTAWQGVELIGLRKNREQFPVEISFGEVVKQGHHVFTGFIRDITDRKRVEDELRSSERELRHIAAQLERERAGLVEAQGVAKMGSWEADLQSLNVIWSKQTHRIFETDPSRFHPTRPRFREFIHPEDRAKVDAAFVASLDKRSPCTVEYRVVMPDGRVKILEERWQAFHDEEGKPVRVAGTCRDITEHVRAEEELRRLSGQLLRLQDEERRRIARDLHDSTGQDLVALATMLGQLRDSISSSNRKSRKLLSECQALADRCVYEVRTLSYVLHPPVLDQAGLGDAIREYVGGFTRRSEIHVELELPPNLGRMARDVELTLFRVVQESLTNIQRHSGSQQAKIRIDRTSELKLEISDLGRGLSAGVPRGKEERRFEVGVGIPSMQERVKAIGGRLDIESSSQGTTVRVTIPLAGEPA